MRNQKEPVKLDNAQQYTHWSNEVVNVNVNMS